MRRLIRMALLGLVCLGFVPAVAHAQTASIAGVVKDTSGAVLPGVTVEAASPALIEKVRSVATDGAGQYKIVDLRPGTYSVTFALTGFSTVKHEGIELAGSFAATVNAEMKVGTVAETVTVTGESPVVDVQSANAERALTKDVLESIPAGRNHLTQAVLIPGLTSTQGGYRGNLMDVGGTSNLQDTLVSIHGGRTEDTRVMIDGVRIGNMSGAGQWHNVVPDEGATQEVVVNYGAINAEQISGGLAINYVPRDGGNTWKGTFFGTGVTRAWQGNNITPELQAAGFGTPNTVEAMYDINPSGGGPIMKDKLWFWASARFQENKNNIAGFYENANAGDPTKWNYVPSTQIVQFSLVHDNGDGRVTWQALPKHKFTFLYDQERRLWDDNYPLVGPEASDWWRFPRLRTTQVGWTSPLTSRLLFEARFSNRGENFESIFQGTTPRRDLIAVNEQGGVLPGLWYRGHAVYPFFRNLMPNLNTMQFNTSYVTGSHALKFGITDTWGYQIGEVNDIPDAVSYRFNNGVPNQITEFATPYASTTNIRGELGLFAQDKWTVRKLTLTGGIRFDWLSYYYPETHIGPGPLAPNRNFTLPFTESLNWKDLTPRVGAAYDLFGDGKTALKASFGRYVINADSGAGGGAAPANPVSALAVQTSRAWNPSLPPGSTNYYIPQCTLLNPLANGDCGVVDNLNFGGQTPAGTYDPKTYTGWGTRPYDWEFTASAQRQIVPRIALEVAYFRRIYGNFTVTKNLALTASDFTPYSIVAPLDPRLPNGGGYTVSGLYDLNPNKVGQVNNITTAADNYGPWIEHWNGVDVTVSARTQYGLVLQGGTDTGRRSTDVCAIRAKVPEMNVFGFFDTVPFISPTDPYCHVDGAFITQIKLLGSNTIPRADVLIGATFQSLPGPQIGARYIADNTAVQPSLGRPLSGGAANVTVNLLEPAQYYVPRANLFDVRIGKILRFGGRHVAANLDIHNLFNTSPVLLQNDFLASWQTPLQVMSPRLFKLSFTAEF